MNKTLMTHFRYEAVDSRKTPVYGVLEAADSAALAELLSNRGLRLISSSELSLDSLIAANANTLPRLFQLRIGEQLREALLTGLPAHEAVRAIAAEPLSHPVTGFVAWGEFIAVALLILSTVVWRTFGILQTTALMLLILVVVILPSAWLLLRHWFEVRPREFMRRLADRLEAGGNPAAELMFAAPRELRCVMKADISEEHKARVSADLMPQLLSSNLRGQQFIMTLIGPLIIMGAVIFGLHTVMLFVVPQFKQMFDDFGVSLPMMTLSVLGTSELIVKLGSGGWFMMLWLLIGGTIALLVGMMTTRLSEILEAVPVVGIPFRWTMQARVARVLAAMVRNDVSYAESLRTATAGSGFRLVESHGEILAREIERRSGTELPTGKLSGLPLSMLFVADTTQESQQRRTAIAGTFQSLSEMLESATVGQGRLLAIIVQVGTMLVAGTIIGYGVIALFLPLIRLLNDLS
ncbi:MAG: hypothetical protein KDA89_21000 [Planctomycetaceae bacterium]|nr:hypothetical protein [Planctomycetaceae bacterium]